MFLYCYEYHEEYIIHTYSPLGVVAYDLQFFLQYMVSSERLITIADLNESLKSAPLSKRDSANRPKNFKIRKANSKYEGNAGSLRILSRILPVILSEQISTSQVGEAILKLEELCQLVTAPQLTVFEVENIMHFTIIEYLDLRRNLIEEIHAPVLKPKHYFMSHYAHLYLENGPLIQLWAMRMESKHVFFKGCIRTAKNFKNVCKTCSVRHQRAQLSLYYRGLFPKKIDVPDQSAYCDTLPAGMNFSPNSLSPAFVKVWGTKYEPGMLVVPQVLSYGILKVGLIKALIVDGSKVYFKCDCFRAELGVGGIYTTKNQLDCCVCELSCLADHKPLKRLGSLTDFSFVLHHFISEASNILQ